MLAGAVFCKTYDRSILVGAYNHLCVCVVEYLWNIDQPTTTASHSTYNHASNPSSTPTASIPCLPADHHNNKRAAGTRSNPQSHPLPFRHRRDRERRSTSMVMKLALCLIACSGMLAMVFLKRQCGEWWLGGGKERKYLSAERKERWFSKFGFGERRTSVLISVGWSFPFGARGSVIPSSGCSPLWQWRSLHMPIKRPTQHSLQSSPVKLIVSKVVALFHPLHTHLSKMNTFNILYTLVVLAAVVVAPAAAFSPRPLPHIQRQPSTTNLAMVSSLKKGIKRVKDSLTSQERSREDLKLGIAGFYDRSSKLWEDVWGKFRTEYIQSIYSLLYI